MNVHPLLTQTLALARGGLCRQVVTRGKSNRERGAAAHLADDRDRAVQLLDDALRDREAEAEPAALGRDEVVEDRREPLGRNAAARVGDGDLDVRGGALGRDGDAAAGLRRLDR